MNTVVFGLVKITVDDILELTFKNGDHIKGHVIDNSKKSFIIKNKQDKIKVNLSDINHIKKLGKIKKYDSNYNWLK